MKDPVSPDSRLDSEFMCVICEIDDDQDMEANGKWLRSQTCLVKRKSIST